MTIQKIDNTLLSEVSNAARESQRFRMNHNFHQYEDLVQRFLNAIEPESYICPHRHINPHRDESFVILKGKGGIVLFDDSGNVTETIALDPLQGQYGIDIPGGYYHTILSLEKGTVFYEVKSGPYNPNLDKGFAPWAPAEGSASARPYLESLKKRFLE